MREIKFRGKRTDGCNSFEQGGIINELNKQGWKICNYSPEDERGMTKDKIGFMLKDLIIED